VTAALGPERRLAQLRLILPAGVPPAGRYVPAARSGSHVHTFGQVPLRAARLIATGQIG
jgi:hypothetical protein